MRISPYGVRPSLCGRVASMIHKRHTKPQLRAARAVYHALKASQAAAKAAASAMTAYDGAFSTPESRARGLIPLCGKVHHAMYETDKVATEMMSRLPRSIRD